MKYLPRPKFGNDTAICAGMTIQLIAAVDHADGASYLWSNGATTPSLSVIQSGQYSLSVTNECGTLSDQIVVKNGVCKLFVPSAFTPNRDGRNDIFKPGYGENVTAYNMEIYNRWGERIFTSSRIPDGWDGRIKGEMQPPGIFVWQISYKVVNEPQTYYLKGTVALIY
jgi:gliding motility-associated-like protein